MAAGSDVTGVTQRITWFAEVKSQATESDVMGQPEVTSPEVTWRVAWFWGGKKLACRENRGLIQHGGWRSRGLGWETADPGRENGGLRSNKRRHFEKMI